MKDNKYEIAFKFNVFRHEHLINRTAEIPASIDLFKPERRNQYMVLFSGYAGAIHYVDDKQVTIPPYSALFIGPDRLSHFEKEVQPNTHILVFSDLFYSRCPKDASLLQNSPLFHNFDAVYLVSPPEEALDYIRGLVTLLYEAQENSVDDVHQDLAHNIVQQILLVGTTRHHRSLVVDFQDNIENLLVLQFRKLLDTYYTTEKNVTFYTDRLNVTGRRLNTATKSVLNLTPKELITRKIMDEARWQMVYTSKSIKEISVDLGYPDEHNFSAFFLKNEGVRPKTYQSNHK